MANTNGTEKSEKTKSTKTKASGSSKAASSSQKSQKSVSGKTLVILESPYKVKAVKKYLGNGYEVVSSKGHVRDLPSSRMGVDIANGFLPDYVIPRKDGKAAVVKELKAAASSCQKIYLATDPDREGEAIAYHLAEILGLDPSDNIRVSFNEITNKAVSEAIKIPRPIDSDRFNAQQARRVLDRLVGYELSPFLWKKVKRGLSAGRVQSVATKMIVDREREIQAFVTEEYWNLYAVFAKQKGSWKAVYSGVNGEKSDISNEQEADSVIRDVSSSDFVVSSIKKQEKVRQPHAPFITSTLQQDASSRLNMRPQRTMSVAQQLYEGLEVKGYGTTGLITYMRTDSLRVSDDARIAAENYIKGQYGDNYYPSQARVFKTKANAQDAHEAIRPTDITLSPDRVKESLTAEQYKLYKLIWERFLASQMAAAVYDTMSVEITAKGASGSDHLFRNSFSKLVFPGFTVLYNDQDDPEKKEPSPSSLNEGEILKLNEIQKEQKFTQPPARYTEASLVKALEENGIARPSTYATIISTITDRGYVVKDGKILKPTDLGFITTELMEQNFSEIVNVEFTAGMETQLDEIEDGKKTYLNVMTDFYDGFHKLMQTAEKAMEGVRVDIPAEESDEICDKCGSKMVYKDGRFGRFLACSNYPACKNTKSILIEAQGSCPVCGGRILVKKSRSGKTFYACENSKDCNFMTWDLPTDQKCEKCGSTMFRKYGFLYCQKSGCQNEGVQIPVKK